MTNQEVYEYVRVVNVRGTPAFQAQRDEETVVVHRANPVLGNKHPMQRQTMKERDRVIEAYRVDLEADLATQGPMYRMLRAIAKNIVENEQKIALECFCAPVPCHGNLLTPLIIQFAQELIAEKELAIEARVEENKSSSLGSFRK